jgi:cytochrome c oxidase subunit 2
MHLQSNIISLWGWALACVILCVTAGCNRSGADQSAVSIETPIRVEARGRDFVWHFRYPGEDGQLGTEDDLDLGEQLNLPAGVDVIMSLESDDLIYTWTSPSLNLKEIAVPQLTRTLIFRTPGPGAYPVEVDPLCGWRFLHDEQMGRVVVQSLTDFNIWYLQAMQQTK